MRFRLPLKISYLLFVTILMLSRVPAHAVSTDLNTMMQRALQAVNDHNDFQLKSFVTSQAFPGFDWINSNEKWQADELTFPVPPKRGGPSTYIVFHTWHSCESDGDHLYPVLDSDNGPVLGPEIKEDDPRGYQITDHQLRVRLNLQDQTAHIQDTVTVKPLVARPPTDCLMRLSQDYTVDSILWHNKPVKFQQAGGVLAIASPRQGYFHLTLHYSGVLNHYASDYIRADNATINSYWYPNISRLPATSTVTAIAPPGWIAVGQGNLIRKYDGKNGSRDYVYQNEIPVSFQTLDEGAYTVTSRRADGMNLSICLLNPDPALAKLCLDRLQSVIEFYSRIYGHFPYPTYTLVATNNAFDTPLEGYSMATFPLKDLPDAIAHEVSHTYWGGLLPCTYLHSMWDEAFAHFSELLYDRDNKIAYGQYEPSGTSHKQLGNRFEDVSVVNSDDTLRDDQIDTGYIKGAMVLRLLEVQLGKPEFLNCMRNFIGRRHAGEPAEWSDFENAVNQTTGKNYDWFFRQWLNQTGLPSLTLSNVQVLASNGGYLLTGTISQTDPNYQLTLPIFVHLQNGQLETASMSLANSSGSFAILCPTQPADISIDPQNIIPLAKAQNLFQVISSTN